MVCNCKGQLNSRAVTLVCLIVLLPVLFGVGGWFAWIGLTKWDPYEGYFWFSLVLFGAGLSCLIGALYLGCRYRNSLSRANYRDEAFEAHQKRKAAAQRGEDIPPPKKLLRDII
ncbi:uncharacterized protein LOC144445863 isoform X2 [Glandiceps talaboti]